MEPIITDVSREQIGKLALGVQNAVNACELNCYDTIERILSNHSVDWYDAADGSVHSYSDKCGNNVNWLLTAAMILQEALSSNKEDTTQKIKSKLEDICGWRTGTSDKPIYPGETRPQAMTRVLRTLEDNIGKHTNEFTGDENRILAEGIAGYRKALEDISRYSREAERLLGIISIKGAQL